MAISVFPELMNRIDTEDVDSSLRMIESYINYIVERVEFSLTNNFKTVNNLGVTGEALSLALSEAINDLSALTSTVAGKVDKVEGKGLSTNDYTDEEKEKLAEMEPGGEPNVIETVKRNGTALPVTNKSVDISVPTKVSDLTNDSGYLTQETDPTVPAWAKAGSKPSYTAQEVGALPDSTVIPSKVSDLLNDSGYQTAQQVQAAVTAGMGPLLTSETYGPAAVASFAGAGDGLPLKTCQVDIQPAQTGNGTPSPTNVRPISGWTGANIFVSPTTVSGNGKTYAVDWTTEAGEVYGGTLDVLTGVLTVTHGCVDLGALVYSVKQPWGIDGTFQIQGANNPAFAADLENTADRGVMLAICSRYQNVIANGGTYASVYNGQTTGFAVRPDTKAVAFYDPAFAGKTGTEIQTALTGQKLVYLKASPVTYQLTPQAVTALAGTNNIWANCGDVTVEYGAFLAALQAEIDGLDNRETAIEAVLTNAGPILYENAQDVYVETGQTSVMSVKALGAVTYKWEHFWNSWTQPNWEGKDTDTLHIPAATSQMNLRQVRCTITGSGWTIYSRVAYVHVT